MEAEVNTLMGAVDKALWHSVGLFASVDELSASTSRQNLQHNTSSSLHKVGNLLQDKHTQPDPEPFSPRVCTDTVVEGLGVIRQTTGARPKGVFRPRTQGRPVK